MCQITSPQPLSVVDLGAARFVKTPFFSSITKFLSCEITPKTGAGICVHSQIKCDIEQKSISEVN